MGVIVNLYCTCGTAVAPKTGAMKTIKVPLSSTVMVRSTGFPSEGAKRLLKNNITIARLLDGNQPLILSGFGVGSFKKQVEIFGGANF